MTKLPPERAEAGFADYKPAYTQAQALAEANRCLYCVDAPCVQHCPTAINIPEFIRKISTGNVEGAARTIFSANVLGMSCARVCPVEVLCAGACVYNDLDSPAIEIGKLQRYATDAAFNEGWEFFTAGPASGKTVGIVGGGPAALAAAHELRRQGHGCTIYDAGGVLGGLNTTGVAPYKMRADRALAEVEWILQIGGIEVVSDVVVGRDLSFAEVEERHDALVIALGLGEDRMLDIPGQQLAGIHGAVAFIAAFKLGQVDLAGVQHAVVLGGGNTAVDAVRELLGLGVPEVTMLYRGDEAQMSGYGHEWKAAKVEGARASWRSLPLEYLAARPSGSEAARRSGSEAARPSGSEAIRRSGSEAARPSGSEAIQPSGSEADQDGRVAGLRCARLGADRKPVAGAEFELPAQLVLLAIGQARLGAMAAALPGVQVVDGRVVVDADGATGRPGVYAAGDCANGGKEVNATAEGKRAAQAIGRLFARQKFDEHGAREGVGHA